MAGGSSEGRSGTGGDALSRVLIALLKGIVVADSDPGLWQSLLSLKTPVQDYVAVLGLDLTVDESEGYAFLRQRSAIEGEEALPRLVPRRKLGYAVSLLLVLLRKRLAENDAAGGPSRLILSRQEIQETVRIFLPDTTNEAKLSDQIETHLNRIVEMGFLRRLAGEKDQFEVRRVLKSFVDAQWMNEFDLRLGEYVEQVGRPARTEEE